MAISEQDSRKYMGLFLKDHPEHIPGYRLTTPAETESLGEPEPMGVMDTETLIAFTEWTIRKGYGNLQKAKALRQHLREKYGK